MTITNPVRNAGVRFTALAPNSISKPGIVPVSLSLLWARITGHSSLVLAALLLSVGTATAQQPSPPPPPKPLVSPPASPSPQPATQTQANPAPAAEQSPSPEASPAQPATIEVVDPVEPRQEQEVLQESVPVDPTIQQQIQTEVDRAFDRALLPLTGAIVALVLFPVAATLAGIWLLRKSVASQVVSEVKEQLGKDFTPQLPPSEKGGSLVKSDAGQMPLALAEKGDNTAHLNELISMALATQNLIAEARSTLEQSMQMQEKMEEPFQEIFGIYVKQGNELFRESRYEDAIEMYEKATEINPDCYEAFLGEGVAFTKLQRYDEAIAAYNKAIRLNTDKADSWYGKARCYALKSDADMAIDNLRQAINLNPQIREMAQYESDFTSIRETEQFDNLMRS